MSGISGPIPLRREAELDPAVEINGCIVMFLMPSSSSGFLARSIKTLPFLAVTIGPLFFCIGLWMGYSSSKFIDGAMEVEALVTIIEEKQGDNGILYRPTFELEAVDGRRVRFVGNTWVSPKPHEVGDLVAARYSPETGIIRSDVMLAQAQFIGGMFMRIGGIVALLGAGFFAWLLISIRRSS